MSNFNRIFESPVRNKPRERLLRYGAQSLSDVELLAIILGTGTKSVSVYSLAKVLFENAGGLRGLFVANIRDLLSIKGLGLAKAATIKALCELSVRIHAENLKKPKIVKPQDVKEVLHAELFMKQEEHLYLISLDSKNFVRSIDLLTVGTINETLLHPRDVFRRALAVGAVSIILVHNHPSGDPCPSKGDIEATKVVADAGDVVGVPLLDHVIFCDDSYLSIKSKLS